jgi:hypothetical protein
MKLLEILNTKFTDAKVSVDNDEEYEVSAKIGDRVIRFGAEKYPTHTQFELYPDLWEIAFSEEDDGDELNHKKYDLTKSGKEFEVFAFIKQCMEHLIEKRKPGTIKFTADKIGSEGRADVYEKMLKKFLKGYKITKMDDGSRQVKFTLEKQ